MSKIYIYFFLGGGGGIFDESTADDILYFYLFNVNNDHDNKKNLLKTEY